MRKFIIIAVMVAFSSSAHAHVLDNIDNWLLRSEAGKTIVSMVKSLGLPVRAKFR